MNIEVPPSPPPSPPPNCSRQTQPPPSLYSTESRVLPSYGFQLTSVCNWPTLCYPPTHPSHGLPRAASASRQGLGACSAANSRCVEENISRWAQISRGRPSPASPELLKRKRSSNPVPCMLHRCPWTNRWAPDREFVAENMIQVSGKTIKTLRGNLTFRPFRVGPGDGPRWRQTSPSTPNFYQGVCNLHELPVVRSNWHLISNTTHLSNQLCTLHTRSRQRCMMKVDYAVEQTQEAAKTLPRFPRS